MEFTNVKKKSCYDEVGLCTHIAALQRGSFLEITVTTLCPLYISHFTASFFLENQFDILNDPELTVYVEKQLCLAVLRQNYFPAISHSMAGNTEKPLAHVTRRQHKACI